MDAYEDHRLEIGATEFLWRRGPSSLRTLGALLREAKVCTVVLIYDPALPLSMITDLRHQLLNIRLLCDIRIAGEVDRTAASLGQALDVCCSAGATPDTTVIACGGGCVVSFAGSLAALLYRGVRLVLVPTTSLAMVDAAITARYSVNAGGKKNAVGVFYNPYAVVSDPNFLATLPDRGFHDGLVESLKVYLVTSRLLAGSMAILIASAAQGERHYWPIIELEAVRAKLTFISRDPREQGPARSLHYGHEVGHTIEEALPDCSHGAAVAIGMLVSGLVAFSMGLLSEDDLAIHNRLIGPLVSVPPSLRAVTAKMLIANLIDAREHLPPAKDKDHVRMVLLEAVGSVALQGKMPLMSIERGLLEESLDQVLHTLLAAQRTSAE